MDHNKQQTQNSQSGSDNDDWTLVSPAHTSSSSSSSSLVCVAREAIEEELTAASVVNPSKNNAATGITASNDEPLNNKSPSNIGNIKNVLDSLSENLLKQSSSCSPLLRSDYQYTTDNDDITTDNMEDNDEDGDDEDDDYDANQTEMSSADSLTSTSSVSSSTSNEDLEIIDDEDSEGDIENFMRHVSDNKENDDATILQTMKSISDDACQTNDHQVMGFSNSSSCRKTRSKSQTYRSHSSTKTHPSKTTQSSYSKVIDDTHNKALATSNGCDTSSSDNSTSIIDRLLFNLTELKATLDLKHNAQSYVHCKGNRLNVALTTSVIVAFVAAVGFGIGNFLGWSTYRDWALSHNRGPTVTTSSTPGHHSNYHQSSSRFYHHYHLKYPVEPPRPIFSPSSPYIPDVSLSEPQLTAIKLLHDELILCLKRQTLSQRRHSIKYHEMDTGHIVDPFRPIRSILEQTKNQAIGVQKEGAGMACFGQEDYWRNRFEKLSSDHGINLRRLISDIKNGITDDLIRETYHDSHPDLKLSLLSDQIEYLDIMKRHRTHKRLEDTVNQLKAENFELSQRLSQPRDEEYQQMMIGLEMRISKLQRENDAIRDTLSKRAGPMYMKQLIELEQLDRENDLFKQFYNHVSKQVASALTAIDAERNIVPDFLPLDEQSDDLGQRLQTAKNGLNMLTKNINHIILENDELKETAAKLRWSSTDSLANETYPQQCSQPVVNISFPFTSEESSTFPSAVGADDEPRGTNDGDSGKNTSFNCQECRRDLKNCLATSSWLHTDVAYWKRYFLQKNSDLNHESEIRKDNGLPSGPHYQARDVNTKSKLAGNESNHDLLGLLHSLVSQVSKQSSTFSNLVQEVSRSINKSSSYETSKGSPHLKFGSSDRYSKHQNVSSHKHYNRINKKKKVGQLRMPVSIQNQTEESNGATVPEFASLTELLTRFLDVYTNKSTPATKASSDSQQAAASDTLLSWSEAAKKSKELELERIRHLVNQADHSIISKSHIPLNTSGLSHGGMRHPNPYMELPAANTRKSDIKKTSVGLSQPSLETKITQSHQALNMRYTNTNEELSNLANRPTTISRDYHIGAGQMQQRHQQRQKNMILSDDNKIRDLISKAWLQAEMAIKDNDRLIGGNSLQLSEPRLNLLTSIVVDTVKLIAGPVDEELSDIEQQDDHSDDDTMAMPDHASPYSSMSRPAGSAVNERISFHHSKPQRRIHDDIQSEIYKMADYMRLKDDNLIENNWYSKRAKQRKHLRQNNIYHQTSLSSSSSTNNKDSLDNDTYWMFKRAKIRERQRRTSHKSDYNNNHKKNSRRHYLYRNL